MKYYAVFKTAVKTKIRLMVDDLSRYHMSKNMKYQYFHHEIIIRNSKSSFENNTVLHDHLIF